MAAPSTAGLALPSAQALQSSEQMMLLNAVDELRAHGLGEITALPQLVVCGDQSSGKSSVLEAISGVPFPRKANVCTRFATEVILRRARVVRMSVSIVPSQDLPRQDRERILGFRHDLASIDDFADLFEKAKEAMGISDNKKTFSKDVLRVEFWGPTQPQLTLVDLPGLIHSETNGQTKDDIKLVDDLVTSYLKSPASIILAIISARYDINNQVILRRAREVDPDGKRTLGIITKPDTIDNDDDEREFIKIARNENVRFVLGWHVVKNLPSGSPNTEPEHRDEKETEFFNQSAFSVLPRKDIGIASLRSRLSNVLFDQIKGELPRLVEEIESRVRATKAAQNRLGPSRSTLDEQRSFLTELSESFQNICRDAVAGHYVQDFFRDDANEGRCLCAILMNKRFNFARSLRRRGALWKIAPKEHEDGNYIPSDEDDSEDDEDEDEDEDESDDERKISRQEAIKDACKVLERTRGWELPGLPNPLLVGELFREYSRPWEGLARDHITDVWNTARLFIEIVLRYLTDGDVRDKILRHWLDPIMERNLEVAEEKLKELLKVHKDHPMTTNDNFIKNRRKLQSKRSEKGPTANMDLAAAEDALDNMNAFYKVAMNLFMDNVPNLAIQAPIIAKLPSMLSPAAVSKMDVEMIKKIAGESEEKVREREETLRRLEKLENGARICKEYSLRRRSVSRPADGSSNIASEQSTGNRRARGRGHSPSVPGDGQASFRAEEKRTDPSPSMTSRNTLNVPSTPAVQRPASPGSSFGGGGLYSQAFAGSTVFNSRSDTLAPGSGFGTNHTAPTTSASSSILGATGSPVFSFANPPSTVPPFGSSTSAFGALKPNTAVWGFGTSNQTGSTSPGLFGGNPRTSPSGSVFGQNTSNDSSGQGPTGEDEEDL